MDCVRELIIWLALIEDFKGLATFIESTLCLQSGSGHLFFPHLKSLVIFHIYLNILMMLNKILIR